MLVGRGRGRKNETTKVSREKNVDVLTLFFLTRRTASSRVCGRQHATAFHPLHYMGTDYAARKAAKRRGKKAGAEAAADGGSRPKRRNGPRRQCTGPCFDVPKVSGS